MVKQILVNFKTKKRRKMGKKRGNKRKGSRKTTSQNSKLRRRAMEPKEVDSSVTVTGWQSATREHWKTGSNLTPTRRKKASNSKSAQVQSSRLGRKPSFKCAEVRKLASQPRLITRMGRPDIQEEFHQMRHSTSTLKLSRTSAKRNEWGSIDITMNIG